MKFTNETVSAVNGRPTLNVVRTGDRPAVMLVHGANSTHAVWHSLMRELAAIGIESAAVELRGHGESGGAEHLQSFGIEDYVTDVLAALEHVPTAGVLVGHSMGGLVVQLAAARTQLKGLVLLASSPVGGMRRDGTRMFFRHPIRFLGAMRRQSFAHLYRKPGTCRSLLFSQHTPESVIQDFMAGVIEESWRAGNEMNTLLPDPAAVKCPVLVVGGADDFMVSADSVRATAKAYGTEAVFIPRAGHMVQLESDPAVLARLVADLAVPVEGTQRLA